MRYTTITKQDARRINEELTALLKPWAVAHGLDLRLGGGTFDSMSFKPRLELTVAANADGKSKAQAEFEQYATMLGLAPSDYGKTIRDGQRTYTVVGLTMRRGRGRAMVALTRDDGRQGFRMPLSIAQARLGHFTGVADQFHQGTAPPKDPTK
jgi:hypothetical protein